MTSASSPQRVLVDGCAKVRWVDDTGTEREAADRCPHRRAPLSAGTVVDGVLQCPYHGWQFDGGGRCVAIPAMGPDATIAPRAKLDVDVPTDGEWLDGDTPGLAYAWNPVCRIGELPDDTPFPVALLGETWTLTRSGGSLEAVSDSGRSAAEVSEHLDHVWVAPAAPIVPLPAVPEWGDPTWQHRRLSRAEGRFGVGLLLDNQLDAGHFAFVHANSFGSPATAVLPPASVDRDGHIVRTTMRVPIAGRNDPEALAGDRELQQHRVMHYEFHAPLWLRLQLDYEEMGSNTLLLFSFIPQAAGVARVDLDVLFHRPGGFTEDELDARMAFEEQVVGEDLALQARFDDLRLPLEPTVEVSTRADRFSLACRQTIRQFLHDAAAVAATAAGTGADDTAPTPE